MLARRLASRGLAVGRFHYVGTGNSDGDLGDVTIAGMAADAAAVAAALAAASGTDRIGFVATRLGSLPASSVASGWPGTRLVETGGLGPQLPKGVDAGEADGRDAARC